MRSKNYVAALLAVAGCSAYGQDLLNSSVTGSAFLNGGSFGGGGVNWNDSLEIRAGGSNGSSSSMSLTPNSFSDFRDNRTMIRFNAWGFADSYFLPSDNQGGTASANAGDSTVMATWAPNAYFQNPGPHTFNASVNSASDEGGITAEVKQTATPQATRSAGSYVVDMLDNSIYDQDSTAGHILLDTQLTPVVTLNYTTPEYTFFRDSVHWVDGSETNSMFRDDVASGMWFILDDQNSVFNIYGSDFSPSKTFAVGDGPSSQVVDGYSHSMTFDISSVLNGNYLARYWAIPWVSAGYPDGQLGGGSGGFVEQELTEQVQVVPEPATMAVLGLGALMLRRRRKLS